VRVLRQRRVRHAYRRLGLAVRARHRLVRLHLAVGVGQLHVGPLAAPARRRLRDRGAVLPRGRSRGVGALLGVARGPSDAGRGTGLMPLVRTEHLTKTFGALTAVNDVSIDVKEGTLHSVIGPNGAGKTTFFNLLTGQHTPTSGRIVFNGRDIVGTPPHGVAHLGIARSFQRTSIFPTLSILDNVWLSAFARQDSWRGLAWRRADGYPESTQRALVVLGEVGLGEKAGQPAREISHGEQRQLELAIALAATPRLLLLDEPAAGLSPDETQKMVALV